MIVKLEECRLQAGIEVTVKYPTKNKVVERIVFMLKSIDEKIECYLEDTLKKVNISDIYYVESVDKKTFICCEKESLQSKLRLYQLNEKLAPHGFVQISKYCILNISKLDKMKPLFNSRMEAVLSNGIRLHVTRKYLAGIRQKLQEDLNA
jgi:DNA-binding LytR/AlgR family response regulator